MTQPYIGEIQLFGFNFNPRGWAFANGATLPISQNTALFSLVGTIYGGNGQTTFQLPNFSGRAGCQQGNGPGLSPRALGETFGANTVTLTSNQIPQHNHGINAFVPPGASAPVANGALSQPAQSTSLAGGSQPHENCMPTLTVQFCIATQGIFPSQA